MLRTEVIVVSGKICVVVRNVIAVVVVSLSLSLSLSRSRSRSRNANNAVERIPNAKKGVAHTQDPISVCCEDKL